MTGFNMTEMFAQADIGEGDTVYVALDTSGGMSQHVAMAALAGTAAACEEKKIGRILFMQFDTRVMSEADMTTRFDMLRDLQLYGGGGTNAKCVLERVVADRINPERVRSVIFITDGLFADMEVFKDYHPEIIPTFVIWDTAYIDGVRRSLEPYGEVIAAHVKSDAVPDFARASVEIREA